MGTVVICLICFAAIALWILFSVLNGIRGVVIGLSEMIVTVLVCLIGYGILNVVLKFLIIIFTDASLLKEHIGGFWEIVGAVVVIGIVIAIIGGLLALVGALASILFNIVIFILSLIITIFETLEEKAKDGYCALITMISNRVSTGQGVKK